jgi:hypothetical protein
VQQEPTTISWLAPPIGARDQTSLRLDLIPLNTRWDQSNSLFCLKDDAVVIVGRRGSLKSDTAILLGHRGHKCTVTPSWVPRESAEATCTIIVLGRGGCLKMSSAVTAGAASKVTLPSSLITEAMSVTLSSSLVSRPSAKVTLPSSSVSDAPRNATLSA